MTKAFRPLLVVMLLAVLYSGRASLAAEDPDWPCIQRLVPEIAAGMIWAGPPLDSVDDGVDDRAIEELAAELAARRVPLDDATARIEAFANALSDAERNARLTRLFARTLAIINRDRSSIIQGIRKYARGQRALAEKITAQNERLGELETTQVLERDALIAERDWDLRIYDDRQRALTYLCEQPVLLEQRAFALARAIAGHLQ